MKKGFAIHINSTQEDFLDQIDKIIEDNHGSIKGITEIEVVLYDDKDLKTGINETTGQSFSYVGAGKVLELASFKVEENENATNCVFVGRPDLKPHVFKFAAKE